MRTIAARTSTSARAFAELQASTPETKGELLGMIVDAYLRMRASRSQRRPISLRTKRLHAHLAIHRLVPGHKGCDGQRELFQRIGRARCRPAQEKGRRGSPDIGGTACHDAEVGRLAGHACRENRGGDDRRWPRAADPQGGSGSPVGYVGDFRGTGTRIPLQALDALAAALEPGASATDAGQSIELPLPPRPIFPPGTGKLAVIRGLWNYYGDLSDFRKCSADDRAYVEHCLQGPQPRPPAAAKPTAAQAMAAMLDALAIIGGLADRRDGDPDAGRCWSACASCRTFRRSCARRGRRCISAHSSWKERAVHRTSGARRLARRSLASRPNRRSAF